VSASSFVPVAVGTERRAAASSGSAEIGIPSVTSSLFGASFSFRRDDPAGTRANDPDVLPP
jgi:hypothetical protein